MDDNGGGSAMKGTGFLHTLAASRVPGLLQSPRARTALGLGLAALFFPVMLVVTACLDLSTPIGDPEKAWADPRVSGVWLSGQPVPGEGNPHIWIFEPWDSRTWLIALITFSGSAGEDADGDEPTGEPPGSEVDESMARGFTVDDGLQVLDALQNEEVLESYQFKGWLTSIGSRRFLVMELRGGPDSDRGFSSPGWLVFRLVLEDDRVLLYPLQTDVEDLSQITARGPAEQVILRHADDPNFYKDGGVLYRVPQSAYDKVSRALSHAWFCP
jgi:hypothetical protein